jgi:PAS domain-containing protein
MLSSPFISDEYADDPPLGEHPTDVLWSMTPAGEITFVSSEVEDVRGIDAEAARIQPLTDTQTEESMAKTIAYLLQMQAVRSHDDDAPTFRDHLDYKRADGSIYRCLVVAVPRRAADGSVQEILGVSRGVDTT